MLSHLEEIKDLINQLNILFEDDILPLRNAPQACQIIDDIESLVKETIEENERIPWE